MLSLIHISKREEEIRSFQPKEYYGLAVYAGGVKWNWQDNKSKNFRTFKKEQALQIEKEANGKVLRIVQVEKKDKKSYAPGLYDLTTLQREANQRYGLSAKETLNIMQRTSGLPSSRHCLPNAFRISITGNGMMTDRQLKSWH